MILFTKCKKKAICFLKQTLTMAGHIRPLESFTSWIKCDAKKLLIVVIFITACIEGKKNFYNL